MAIQQPLVPTNIKQYAMTSNFNKGYNKNVADGVIDDSTFRDMLNFSANESGKLRKRNGHKLSELQKIIEYYLVRDDNYLDGDKYTPNNPDFNAESTTVNTNNFSGEVNGASVGESALRDTLIQELIYMKGHTYGDYVEIAGSDVGNKTTYTNILNLTVLSDELTFSEKGGITRLNDGITEVIVVLGGELEGYGDITGSGVFQDYTIPTFKYVYIKIENRNYFSTALDSTANSFTVEYNIKYDNVDYDNLVYKLNDKIYSKGLLNIEQFNNGLYFTTGYNIFKIDTDRDLVRINSASAFKPSIIEATNVGFNILANDPLNWVEYNSTSTVNAIKGVFYTIDIGSSVYEPTSTIPTTKVFKINVMKTGTGALSSPKYRQDNGETDDTANPWLTFKGSYTGSIFECSGFDLSGNFEIKIEQAGAEDYRGYFTTGASTISETGRVSDIKDLIQSSLYCKVINNQLVLYGGHGYLFFSEYSNFTYFPNYYNIYATNEVGDEVIDISYFRQYYAIYTKKLIKRLTGSFGSEDFGLFKLNDFVGCENPNTVKQVENNLFFISDAGLYRLKQGYTGEGTENVDQIDLAIDGDYDKDSITNAVVFDTRYILSTSTGAYIYDFDQASFYKYEYGNYNDNNNSATYSPLFVNLENISKAFVGQILYGEYSTSDYKTYSEGRVTACKTHLLDTETYSTVNEALLESIEAQALIDLDEVTTDSQIESITSVAITALINVETGLG